MTALLENRDAKPGFVAEGETKVGPTHFLQFLLITFWTDTLHQADGIFRSQRFGFKTYQVAPQPEYGGLAGGDVQIAGTFTNHRLEHLVDLKSCSH